MASEEAEVEEVLVAKPRRTKLIIAVVALVFIIIIGVFFAVTSLKFGVPSKFVEAPPVSSGWNLIAQYNGDELIFNKTVHITFNTFRVKINADGAEKYLEINITSSWEGGWLSTVRFRGYTSPGRVRDTILDTINLVNKGAAPPVDVKITIAFSESIKSWGITIEGK